MQYYGPDREKREQGPCQAVIVSLYLSVFTELEIGTISNKIDKSLFMVQPCKTSYLYSNLTVSWSTFNTMIHTRFRLYRCITHKVNAIVTFNLSYSCVSRSAVKS